jgi:hypothetical protein
MEFVANWKLKREFEGQFLNIWTEFVYRILSKTLQNSLLNYHPSLKKRISREETKQQQQRQARKLDHAVAERSQAKQSQ